MLNTETEATSIKKCSNESIKWWTENAFSKLFVSCYFRCFIPLREISTRKKNEWINWAKSMQVFSIAIRKPMFVRIFAEELVVLIRCASAVRRSVILEHTIMANWMNQFLDITCAYTQLWIKWDHANQSDRSQWLSNFFCFTRILFSEQWNAPKIEKYSHGWLVRRLGSHWKTHVHVHLPDMLMI